MHNALVAIYLQNRMVQHSEGFRVAMGNVGCEVAAMFCVAYEALYYVVSLVDLFWGMLEVR